jgi:uncharacterized protein YbaP (TraB family)
LNNIYPLCFWKLRDRQPEAHILGSVHFLSSDMYPLPAHIEAVIDRAEVVMFEVSDSKPSQSIYLRNIFHDPIAVRLGAHPDLLARLRQTADAQGTDLTAMDDYSLWFIAYVLNAGSLEGLGKTMVGGVDEYVRRRCKDRAQFEPLETGDEMVSGLTGMSLDGQIRFLRSVLDGIAEKKTGDLGEVGRAWREGNIGYFARSDAEEARTHPEQHRVLLTNRNVVWTRNIHRVLRLEKRTLIVGGAAHFAGEGSVPQLLKRGYRIRVDQIRS